MNSTTPKINLKNHITNSTFWDADLNNLNIEKDKSFLISRIAERGNDMELNFILNHFTKTEILYAVDFSAEITPRTKNYFHKILK